MDLKAMFLSLKENAVEAELAFHAGNQEKYDGLLRSTYEIIRDYYNQWTPPAGDVTEDAADVVPTQPIPDLPEQVSDTGAGTAVVDPEKKDQPTLPASRIPKPTRQPGDGPQN